MSTMHPLPAPVDVVLVVVVEVAPPPELALDVGPLLVDDPSELEEPPLPPVPVNGSHEATAATMSASTPIESLVRDCPIRIPPRLVLYRASGGNSPRGERGRSIR
jgi:hypothetical protein